MPLCGRRKRKKKIKNTLTFPLFLQNSSFVMSIKGKVNKFGITTAHISAMTVDLVGPQGTFGRLDIPPNKVGPSGGDVTIIDQTIKITDMEAFKAFVRSILQDETLTLRLDNGEATVKAMGRSSGIVYKKDIQVKGFKGLQTTITSTVLSMQGGGEEEEGEGAGAGGGGGSGTRRTYTSSVEMMNPSPFEIDIGTVHYEVRDEQGTVIAHQKGKTCVKRGTSCFTVVGDITGKVQQKAGSGAPKVQFVGAQVDEDTWFKEIVAAVGIWVTVPDEVKAWRGE